jgi:pilus assembly protein Flp/PilA
MAHVRFPLTVRESTTTMMRRHIAQIVKWLTRDESGQDLLEYGLLAALIALVCVGAITTVGSTIQGVFWTYISGVINAI